MSTRAGRLNMGDKLPGGLWGVKNIYKALINDFPHPILFIRFRNWRRKKDAKWKIRGDGPLPTPPPRPLPCVGVQKPR